MMMRLLGHSLVVCAAGLLGNTPAVAQDAVPVALPSGVELTLQEWLLDPQVNGDMFARFRFIAPEIKRAGGQVSLAALEGDFQVLCDSFAMVNITAQPKAVDRIIISLSDRAVDFGTADPEATQYFEAFRVENGVCIWEYF